MSLKLGTRDIAGISTHTNVNAHSLFDFKWSDHKLNEISWLEASTFSWQSGNVYVTAYNHLVQDIQGTTAETETVGSYTVTFYRATDGHKICLADQETTVLNIYNETGIAWYYVLDTTNTQFKLPRTKYGLEGLRTNVGDIIEAGLPNITGYGTGNVIPNSEEATYYGALYKYTSGGSFGNTQSSGYNRYNIGFDASRSNSIYGNSTTVQPPATQMYLYFYVGDYSQTAIEQTAGLNSELFNGKADTDLSNCTKPHIVETYQNGTSWYRVYSDGWCEQGGFQTSSGVQYYLKPFKDNNYTLLSKGQGTITSTGTPAGTSIRQNYTQTISSYDSTSFTTNFDNNWKMWWQASGYIR